MSPLPPRDLSLAEVDRLFRGSEGRPSAHRLGASSGGHAYGQHLSITNAGLMDRMQADGRNGKVALFTAFITRADMVEAGQDALNSAEGKWARHQLFQAPKTDQHPKGSHNGMRASIYHLGRVRRVRYAGGQGMMPVGDYLLILDRDDSRETGLHIQTFIPTMRQSIPAELALVYTKTGAPFSQGP